MTLPTFIKDQREHHERHADGDGGVRNVERGPVILVIVNIDEVDNHPDSQPIRQVADSAPKDQAQPERAKRMVVRSVMSIVQNEPDGQERDADEERVANPCGLGGQEAECRTRVHDMDDREEIRDEGDAVAEGYRSLDQQLGDLIENDNDERNSVETQPYTLSPISSRTLAQRAQTSG